MAGEKAGRLAGRVALVTGASRPIGKAIALLFAQEGAAVAIAAKKSLEAVQAVAREIQEGGGRALALRADVTQRAEAEEMVARTVAALGSLDILVNNAGFIAKAPLELVSAENWVRSFSVNVDAPLGQMLIVGGGSVGTWYLQAEA